MLKTKEEIKKKTNNFGELPNTKEIWINIKGITLKTYFEEGKYFTGIRLREDEPFILKQINEADEEGVYDIPEEFSSNTIAIYEVLCGEKEDNELMFCNRLLNVAKDEKEFIFTIQVGKEDKEGNYKIDLKYMSKKDMIELANFFKKSEVLFLTELKERV